MDNQLLNHLYSRSRYRGKKFTPENLVFNANLQEFAQRLSFISNLETNGKISAPEAYQQIETLWQSFQSSAQHNLR
ncbi:MAG: hypothetical protein KME17_28020 [Cyanosarcina radialis HA8281-LM2]|jgi:hypothetical protein|nr:hypothetical protein [Cyanosarcina radialis HA8281-LM2]